MLYVLSDTIQVAIRFRVCDWFFLIERIFHFPYQNPKTSMVEVIIPDDSFEVFKKVVDLHFPPTHGHHGHDQTWG